MRKPENRSTAVSRLKPEFSVEKAHRSQTNLSKHIIFEDETPRKIRFVGGVDVAYANNVSIAAVTVFDFHSLRLKESQTAVCKTCFPYIPTLLSFREIPPTVLAIRKLQIQPDVFVVDGHGYAHPYRCGFASHLGLVIRRPTIGVAKRILIGELESSKNDGDTVFLRHKGEVISAQVTARSGQKPIYVSVGHMISLGTAIRIVMHCMLNHRVPEPITVAHNIATAEKAKIIISTRTQKEKK